MKNKQKIMTIIAGLLGLAVTSSQAITFIGAEPADQNFSSLANWNLTHIPTSADIVYIGGTGTAGSPAIVDTGFSNTLNNAFIYSPGGSFGATLASAEVASGATLKSSVLKVGNNANQFFDGFLTLQTGGSIKTAADNGGVMVIGGDGAGQVGTLVAEAGATFQHSRMSLSANGTVQFVFDAYSVSTFTAKKTTAGESNRLDGMIEVDMAELRSDGTHTLIDSSSANLLISGALKTWLDSNGGSVTNTGSFVGSNFTVLNGDDVEWVLSLADGGQDLDLEVTVPKFADQLVFSITDDSWLNGNNDASNWGTQTDMRVRHGIGDAQKAYPIAKFDLSALPANATVTAVRMRFWTTLKAAEWPSPANFAPVAIYNNLGDFSEGTVTWGNAPAVEATASESLDHFGLPATPTYFTGTNLIDSTTTGWLEYQGTGTVTLVQNWADGFVSNYGVTIRGEGAELASGLRTFRLNSKEAGGLQPQLRVDYYTTTDPNPPSTNSGYLGWSENWGVIPDIGSGTNDYDNDGQNNFYEYGLGGDPTNGFVDGEIPTFELAGGFLEYVHAQLSNDTNLTYFLELSDGLVLTNWANSGYTAVTNVTGATFDYVTNSIPTTTDKKFIRLIIE